MTKGNLDFLIVKRITLDIIRKDEVLYKRLVDLTIHTGGAMENWLNDHLTNSIGDCIIYIAKDKRSKEVIGWSIVTPSMKDGCNVYYNKIGTFVDRQYRRQGIGTRLVKAMRKVTTDFAFWTGAWDAEIFYNSIIKAKEKDRRYHNRSWQTVKTPTK